jgi:transcription elongation factor Elf1
MASHYKGDPKWIEAKFNSTCSCGRAIKKGEQIFYYPKGKVAFCSDCGQSRSAEFQSAVQDEDFYNSQY